jgi:hemerythrin superfamily protein
VDVDAIDMIMQEHREVEAIFQQLRQRPDEPLVGRLMEALGAHTEAEERVLYPAVVEALEDGRRLVDEAVAEHREVDELLARLDGRDPSDAESRRLVQQLEQAVQHHVQEEEREMLPRLRERARPDVLETMAQALSSVEAEATGDADATSGETVDDTGADSRRSEPARG